MPAKRSVNFGFFPKTLIGFILLSIVPILFIEYLSFKGMKDYRKRVAGQSKSIISKLSTAYIRQVAMDVSREIGAYLHGKNLKIDEIKRDPYLKSIAVQSVGKTGYTEVYTTDAINIFHKNQEKVGLDLIKLKYKHPTFWKILANSLKSPTGGYYKWKDANGNVREKFIYCVPVKGTNLVVAATTYLDEFYGPINILEANTSNLRHTFIFSYLYATLGYLLLLVIFSYVYAKGIVKPILSLADVVDRISVGNLNTSIDVKTSDEIMILAGAISRMQKSLKSAILRLREKGGDREEA